MTDARITALSAALDALRSAKAIDAVEDDDDVAAARDALKTLKAAHTVLERARTTEKAPHLAAGKEVDDFFRGPKTQLESAMNRMKKAMAKYAAAVREAQLARQQALAAEAAKAVPLKKAAGAESLSEGGGYLTPKLAPDDVPDAPDTPAMATRRVPKLVVYDIKQVPVEYLQVQERKALEALQDGMLVPGCKIEWEERVVAR